MSSKEDVIGYRKTKGFSDTVKRETEKDDTGKIRRRHKEKETTNMIEKSLKKLVKSYYGSSTGGQTTQKTFTELETMKGFTTMNMYLLAQVIYINENNIKIKDGDRDFENIIRKIMDHFHSSVNKKKELEEDENTKNLKILRLKQSIISYDIALRKHYELLEISGMGETLGYKDTIID